MDIKAPKYMNFHHLSEPTIHLQKHKKNKKRHSKIDMNKRKRESSHQNHDDDSEMNDDTLLKHTISEEAKKSYGWTYSKRDLNDADGYDWREKVLMIGCELGHLHCNIPPC